MHADAAWAAFGIASSVVFVYFTLVIVLGLITSRDGRDFKTKLCVGSRLHVSFELGTPTASSRQHALDGSQSSVLTGPERREAPFRPVDASERSTGEDDE